MVFWPGHLALRGYLETGLPSLLKRRWQACKGIQDSESVVNTVIFQVRIPRIVAAMLVGSALSMAGAAYQGMFKNPLVSPDILGVSAGAGFGAALAIYFSFGNLGIQISAFVLSLLEVMAVYFLSNKIKRDPTLALVLTGILVGTI